MGIDIPPEGDAESKKMDGQEIGEILQDLGRILSNEENTCR